MIIKRTRYPRNGKISSIWMSIGLESYFFLVNEFIVDEITQEY